MNSMFKRTKNLYNPLAKGSLRPLVDTIGDKCIIKAVTVERALLSSSRMHAI
jgi:hypothetical protein